MFDTLRDKDDDAMDKADGSSGYGSLDEPATSSAATTPFKTPTPVATTPVKAAGRTPTKRIPKTVRKSLFSDGIGKGHPAVSATPSASRYKKKSEDDLTPRALRALRRASLREGMVLRSSKMLGSKDRDDRQRRKRRTSASSTCSSSTSGSSSFRDMDMKLRSGNIVGTKKTARKEKVGVIMLPIRHTWT